MRLIIVFFILLFLTNNGQAQSLDEETGFIYVKAEYLYETGRYDEAIAQYNLVVAKDASYKDALIHRGMCKFAMGAYKGAKMDAMHYIELKGISSSAAALLGRSFAATNELDAAVNSFSAAIGVEKKFEYYEWRAEVYEKQQKPLNACGDYEMAVTLGSQAANNKLNLLCGGSKIKPKSPPIKNPQTSQEDSEVPNNTPSNQENNGQQTNNGTNNPNDNTPVVDNNTQRDSTVIDDSEPVVDENLPKNDDSVNNLVIDDDLTIEISGQELGIRKINEIPSILILADENGQVTVNICVNRQGVVTNAEFNGSRSTIAKKSLVSLALRKAKEFEFALGKYDVQCGTMVFNIKRS